MIAPRDLIPICSQQPCILVCRPLVHILHCVDERWCVPLAPPPPPASGGEVGGIPHTQVTVCGAGVISSRDGSVFGIPRSLHRHPNAANAATSSLIHSSLDRTEIPYQAGRMIHGCHRQDWYTGQALPPSYDSVWWQTFHVTAEIIQPRNDDCDSIAR